MCVYCAYIVCILRQKNSTIFPKSEHKETPENKAFRGFEILLS